MPTSSHHAAAAPPAGCERIPFVGAGGFGRDAVAWARDARPDHVGRFGGFLSDDPSRLDGHACDLSIAGSIASDAARLGRFTLLKYHASAAHDASTGDFAALSPYATLGGGAGIGDDVFRGLHASGGPGIRIGERSKVAANSCALDDAPDDSLIHGIPGRITPLPGWPP